MVINSTGKAGKGNNLNSLNDLTSLNKTREDHTKPYIFMYFHMLFMYVLQYLFAHK